MQSDKTQTSAYRNDTTENCSTIPELRIYALGTTVAEFCVCNDIRFFEITSFNRLLRYKNATKKRFSRSGCGGLRGAAFWGYVQLFKTQTYRVQDQNVALEGTRSSQGLIKLTKNTISNGLAIKSEVKYGSRESYNDKSKNARLYRNWPDQSHPKKRNKHNKDTENEVLKMA